MGGVCDLFTKCIGATASPGLPLRRLCLPSHCSDEIGETRSLSDECVEVGKVGIVVSVPPMLATSQMLGVGGGEGRQ